MSCSDPSKSEYELARAALEEMDEQTLDTVTKVVEEIARRHPKKKRPGLTVVRPETVDRPKKR